MSRFVRASKVRHVYAKNPKKDQCYSGLRLTTATGDHHYIKANTKYMAIPVSQGGSLAIFEMERSDLRLGPGILPVLDGHDGFVMDFDFNPFHTQLIATGGDDCVVKVWGIPPEGLKESQSEALADLQGHQKKVSTVLHNPVADYVLASASADRTVKIWDVEAQEEKCNTDHGEFLYGLAWSLDGEILASTCKDKALRLIDPRTGKETQTIKEAHDGPRTVKVEFCNKAGGGHDAFCTVGFTRQSKRQFKIWDPRNLAKGAYATQNIDQSAGAILPFYDEGTHLLYLAGKGDTNVRYYELVNDEPWQFFVSEYKSQAPAKGMCKVPARIHDTSECEVARFLKLVKGGVEPLSFICPRKSKLFQADLYPDAYAGKAGISDASGWFAGKKGKVHRVSMDPKKSGGSGGEGAAASSDGRITKRKNASELQQELNAANNRIKQLEGLLKKNNISF